jgi:hypothetical protein
MSEDAAADQRLTWSLWAAAGLAILGGVLPFVFGGTSSRVTTVVVPYVIGAIALGATPLAYRQGRTFAAIVYFIAGLAIMFGLLTIFSLPVRLAVLGTCPALPAPCPAGFERPLSDAENTGMGVATALGLLAVFLGFFGLVTLYRRPVAGPVMPPAVRQIPPMPAAVAPPAPPPPTQPEAEAEAPEEPEELPPHEEEEVPELPPHESSSSST